MLETEGKLKGFKKKHQIKIKSGTCKKQLTSVILQTISEVFETPENHIESHYLPIEETWNSDEYFRMWVATKITAKVHPSESSTDGIYW